MKSYAADEKLVVVAEWPNTESDTFQRDVLHQQRALEFRQVLRRLCQRITSNRQRAAQTNVESTLTTGTTISTRMSAN